MKLSITAQHSIITLIIIIFSAFLSVRSDGGHDFHNYEAAFSAKSYSYSEGLFQAAAIVVNTIGFGFSQFLFLVHFVCLTAVWFAYARVYNRSRYLIFTFMLFLAFGQFTFFSLNQMKQALSASILLIIFSYYLSLKSSKSIVIIPLWVLAIYAHFSSAAYMFLRTVLLLFPTKSLGAVVIFMTFFLAVKVPTHNYYLEYLAEVPIYGPVYENFLSRAVQIPKTGLTFLPVLFVAVVVNFDQVYSIEEKKVTTAAALLMNLFLQVEFLERFIFSIYYIPLFIFFGRIMQRRGIILTLANTLCLLTLVSFSFLQLLYDYGKHGVYLLEW